jgi:HCOMODA/2-hydroxy-3-carboxy-muconic semialdehyde decarboxylase
MTMDTLPASDALLQDLVDANHVLFHQGIVDAFGHVSARHDRDPERFVMARNMAPQRVQHADLLEYAVATGEALRSDPPRLYLERFIHSEIYRARPDVMAVVHAHAPAVLPFCVARGARLRPVCHMAGFLGGTDAEQGPALFEMRDTAGPSSDLLVRDTRLGAALAQRLGQQRVVLMRGHGFTVVGESVRTAVYRAIYTENNARVLLQALPLGEPEYLGAGEADEARRVIEGQVARPWALWCDLARQQPSNLAG